MVSADAKRPQTRNVRRLVRSVASQEYISAALAIGGDSTAACLFPRKGIERSTGDGSSDFPSGMTAALQGHLRAGGMPGHLTTHSTLVGGSRRQVTRGYVRRYSRS